MKRKVLSLLESPGYYYNFVLAAVFLVGLYCVFAHEPPTPVSQGMSQTSYRIWVSWHVLAPPTSWIGQLSTNRRRQWVLRWTADTALTILVFTHIVALVEELNSGHAVTGIYLLFIPVVTVALAVGLSIRDLLRAMGVSPRNEVDRQQCDPWDS